MALPSYAMNQASFPELYEHWLAPTLFRPFAENALDAVDLSPGDSVLDIACGTGIVARTAKERLGEAGRVVGVDVSADMLGVARRVAPAIDWREGNAGALPLAAGENFDVVLCQQGLQFFRDKPAAAAEMRRALTPGGRLAVSTWRSDDEIPFLHALRRVAETELGAVIDQRHSYGDANTLVRLLLEAGFHDARCRTVTRTIRFEDGAAFPRLNAMALVGMSAAASTMSAEERKRAVESIIAASAPVLRDYADGTGIAFVLGTNLATARG
jgi:ubiquinone/menaquinone biosynthesis C-methylase UbiE